MRHATPATLDEIEMLLVGVRAMPGLVERKRGIFYRKGSGFLHFHEDAAGVFADIRLVPGNDYERMRVSTSAERKRFMGALRKAVTP